MEEEKIAELVAGLRSHDVKYGCACMRALAEESRSGSGVYAHMDALLGELDDASSYVRTRALALICENARWDNGNKIAAGFDKVRVHILDESAITARKFIQALGILAEGRPALREMICAALEQADFSRYADSMRPLLEGDRVRALRMLRADGSGC